MNELVPKIEGHATFYTHLKNGRVDKAQMIGLENDRFVEKILFGRKYYEAPIITSRICGICPTIHNITSTKAIESACGITPSEQTKQLRKLMLCGQMIQSHSLHLYLLVLPDFVGVNSSFELQKNHPDLFKNAINLKQYADSIIEIIGGRAVHPITNVVGGFKKFPEINRLKKLLIESENILKIAQKTVSLFNSFKYPIVEHKLIYSALSSEKDYAYYDGKIKTTSGINFEANNYKRYIFEELKPYTRAKFGTLRGKTMLVGASSRINLNKKFLGKETHELMLEAGIKKYFNNPFDNIIAQAIENYFFVVESQNLLKYFIKEGIDTKEPIKTISVFKSGTSACEAPRGTLFHYYELDKEGIITKCDIITPTVQNLPALENDLGLMGPTIKDLDREDKNKIIETLIRAYDPCITCATH